MCKQDLKRARSILFSEMPSGNPKSDRYDPIWNSKAFNERKRNVMRERQCTECDAAHYVWAEYCLWLSVTPMGKTLAGEIEIVLDWCDYYGKAS